MYVWVPSDERVIDDRQIYGWSKLRQIIKWDATSKVLVAVSGPQWDLAAFGVCAEKLLSGASYIAWPEVFSAPGVGTLVAPELAEGPYW